MCLTVFWAQNTVKLALKQLYIYIYIYDRK